MPTNREFLPSGVTRPPRTAEQIAAAVATPGFDYPVTQVGVTGNITVSYDPSLGAQGLTLAQQLLNVVAGPYQQMQSVFGLAGGAVTVVVSPLSGKNDGSGGAYHHGCDFNSGGVLYLDATFANTTQNPLDLEVAFYIAELSEAFMGAQNKGWGCGYSNGEGLSRYLAENASPGVIPTWGITGPAWVSAGYPDWVTKTEQTDQDSKSTGCAILYLYWMRSLGYTISEIVQAGGSTLSANYQTLTGKTTAYADLVAAVKAVTVTTDNPFPPQLYQMHGDGTIWYYTGPPVSGWQMLDNNPRARAIAASGNLLYQLHGDGTIWIYTGTPLTGWQMLDNNPRARAIAASGRKLYQLHDDGTIWIYTGPPLTGWQMLDNNPRTIAIAAGDSLYQLHNDGTIWLYTGTPLTGWQMLDNNPATTEIAAAGGNLYQKHGDGTIWVYTGPPMSGWQMVDNNPAAMSITVSSSALYQTHGDGTIWIYTGPPISGWQMLDNNPRERAIAANSHLYQLHGDGTIWNYTGPPLSGWQTLDTNPATTAILVAQ
ncbi:MAG TPA: hypothetical protein VL991_13660 [Terracidiphilus sp.]|nr:hypothetical protein [Terracidiphilus sp.]